MPKRKPPSTHLQDLDGKAFCHRKTERWAPEGEQATCGDCLKVYNKYMKQLQAPKKPTGGVKTKYTIALDEEEAELIRQIETMAACGIKGEDIALVVGVGKDKLWSAMSKSGKVAAAIKSGRAKANTKVGQTAYQMATSGKSPAMTIFWLKCQMRWQEVQRMEIDQNSKIEFVTKIGQDGVLMQEQITDGKGDIDITDTTQ